MESVPPDQCEVITILTMPDYRDINPYQELLCRALSEKNARVLFTNGYRRVFPLYRQVKALDHCDVLHLHWIDPYVKGENWLSKFIYCLKFLLDIYLVKLGEVKVVWTIHNLTSHNAKFPGLEKWLKRRLIAIVDRVIVHSQSARDAVVEAFLHQANESENIVVIPHGHYRDIYPKAIAKKEARQKLGLPTDKLLFLNFGVLKPYKGVEKVVDIWDGNAEIARNQYFLITGKAMDESYGQALKVLVGKVEGIELRDEFVVDEEVHLYFSAADIVILPFNQILTSGSLLLAISYGKPVIAPRLENILETLGDATDFLYDPIEEGALIGTIQASIEADLATESQKVVAAGDRLDWQDIASATEAIYRLE